MKVIIIINNGLDNFNMYQNTGIYCELSKRSVIINLTDAQLEEIGLKKGEIIESISQHLKQ